MYRIFADLKKNTCFKINTQSHDDDDNDNQMTHLNDDEIYDCDNVRKIMQNVTNLKEKHFDFIFSTQFSHND